MVLLYKVLLVVPVICIGSGSDRTVDSVIGSCIAVGSGM